MSVPSQHVCDKAARLLVEARVEAVPAAETFRVKGDDGSYVVTLQEGHTPACTCRSSWWMCSHVGAAILLQHERKQAP